MVLELNPNGGSPPSAVLLFMVQTMRRVWRSDDIEKIIILPASHPSVSTPLAVVALLPPLLERLPSPARRVYSRSIA